MKSLLLLLAVWASCVSVAFAQLTCTGSLTFTIQGSTSGLPISGSLGTITNVSCFGGANGSVQVLVNGGSQPYTISWSSAGGPVSTANSATNYTITGLAASAYSISVTDVNGCSIAPLTTSITQPSQMVGNALVTSNYGGFGVSSPTACDGATNVTPSGGTPPYSYVWSNGQTAANATGVCVGQACVTVTDANSCSMVRCVTLTAPTAINATITGQTNVTCFGLTNGSATVAASGGVIPYSYTWRPSNQTGATANNLGAGVHDVVVRDANGVTTSVNVTITQPSQLSSTATVVSNFNGFGVSAAGACDGSATVAASGATPGYTYRWSNGQTASSTTGLCAGQACATVTDANGCSVVGCVTLTEPTSLTATIASQGNVTCFGFSNGTATVAVNGGVAPYTYLWTPSNQTAAVAIGLAAGTYSVVARDANNVTTSTSVTITQPTQLAQNASITSGFSGFAISCNGLCNATAGTTPSGGTSPYTFVWSNGSTNANSTGLCAGNAQVTVSDANGCTSAASVSVTQAALLEITNLTDTEDYCMPQGGGGSISFQAIGGAAPYHVSWSGAENGNPAGTEIASNGGSYTIGNLINGTYSVTLTDANGCTARASNIVIDPSTSGFPLEISSILVINANCGVNDGRISVTAAGGNPVLSYTWAPPVSTGPIAHNVSAGAYNVTVSDTRGCSVTGTALVQTDEAGPDIATQTTPATCASANGTATVNVNGASGNYTVALFNAQGVILQLRNSVAVPLTFNNLGAGNYSVLVTNAQGCSSSARLTVGNTSGIMNLVPVVSNASSCALCDGSIQAVVTGGQANYTYQLFNTWGALASTFGPTATSTHTFTGLCGGNYTVVVTDGSGCVSSFTRGVIQGGTLLDNANFSIRNATCAGTNNGSISLTAGSTLTNCMLFLNGNNVGTLPVSNLGAGTYQVVCTDALGCVSASGPIQINEPSTLEVNVSLVEESCARNNGAILLATQGGTPNYTYNWGHDNTLMGPNATGLATGVYSFTATDANGCSLIEPNLFLGLDCPCDWVANAIIIHPACGAFDGSIDLSISGGVPSAAYSYSWSNGSTTSRLENLRAQSLCVTITDASGICVKTYCYSIDNVQRPQVSLTSVNGAICNGTQGSITLNLNSTDAPFQVMWSSSSQLNVPNGPYTISNLPAGTYQVTVTTNNGVGCNAILNGIVVPSLPGTLAVPQINSTNATCGLSNGTLSPSITGGTAPFTVTLLSANNLVMATLTTNNPSSVVFSGLAAGLYTIQVVDVNNCQASNSAVLTTGGIDINLSDFSVTMAACPGGAGAINSVLNPIAGVQYTVYPPYNGVPMPIPATNLVPGIYTILATDANGCADAVAVNITGPQPWVVDFYITPANCLDGGVVNVISTGATAPYTYTWGGGQTGANVTGLVAGTHNVTVMDANGCSVVQQIVVGRDCPCALEISEVVIFNAQCANNNGSIRLTTSGANGPVVFNWSPLVSTSNVADNLLAGIYNVVATDSTGCTATSSGPIVVSNVDGPQMTNIATTPTTCNAADGVITFAITGGIQPYSVMQPTAGVVINGNLVEITGLVSGIHNVVIRDNQGCIWGENIDVLRSSGSLAFNTTVSNATCGNNADGSITATVSVGLFPFTYSLNGMNNTPSNSNVFSGLRAGTYLVGVTDANGCEAEAFVVVSEGNFTVSNADFAVTNSTCPGQPNGSFTPVTPGIVFNVFDANGASIPQANWTGLDPGNYTVRALQLSTGCIAFGSFTVTTPDRWYVIFSVSDRTCAGNDGSIIVETTGATPPYSFLWSNGGMTNDTIANLAPGVYVVSITDSRGCVVVDSAVIEDACLCNNFAISDISYLKPTCGSNNGTIDVSIAGGQAPFVAQWNQPVTPPNSLNITGVGPNVYTVIVTDANGCQDVGTVAVENILGPTVSVVATTPTNCTQATGTATLNITGGAAPYTISPQVGNVSGNTITNMPAGNWRVRVEDANQCVGYIDVAIQTGPGNFSIATSTLNPACGLADGLIEVTPQSGSLPFVVQVRNFNGTFTRTINASGVTNIGSLPSDVYIVTVSEGTGCVFMDTVVLDNANGPVITPNDFIIADVTCPGDENGSVYLAPTSPLNPVSVYVVDAATGNQLGYLPQTGLAPGSYFLVAYSGACVTRLPFEIQDKPEWEVGIGAANPLCLAGRALIDVTVSGANPPYRYSWNYNNATTQDLTNIFPGDYKLTITDNLGCVFIDSITVLPCHSDTTVYIQTGQTDTICVELNDIAFNGTLVSVVIDPTCGGVIDNATSVSIGSNNCLVYTALPVTQGIDTICVVVCDNMGFCDTTTVYVVVGYPDCLGFGFQDQLYGQVYQNCQGTDDFCFPIPFASASGFTVTLDGQPYPNAQLQPCNVQSTANYTFSAPACPGNEYSVSWSLGGTIMGPTTVFSLGNIANQLNTWDPNGGWVYSSLTNTYSGGSASRISQNDYGTLNITCVPTSTAIASNPNIVTIARGTSVRVPQGTHVVEFVDVFGCSDSSRVTVFCTPTQIITDTTLITTTEDSCVTTSVPLTTGNASVVEICDGQGNAAGVNFTYVVTGNSLCVTYTGNQLGVDTACFVLCGDFGICDTIRYIVTVYELPPIANPDTITMTQSSPSATIDVCPNDLGGIYREIDNIVILTPPLYGNVTPGSGCNFTYVPDASPCTEDGSPVDSFSYVASNTGGSDTTWVYVVVICDDFMIYNAVSPNGDHFNDNFFIEGILRYPSSELEIYNRWGNLVYNKIGYQNDWDATFDGNPLPDGTYFYVLQLNDGTGREFTGYIEVRR